MTTTPGISAVHLRAAITSTRAMFTNSPEAQAALARVEFMMDIIPAQQGIAGAYASITKETHVATGETQVVGGQLGATNQPQTRMDTSADPATSPVVHAQQAIQYQARADVAEADQAAAAGRQITSGRASGTFELREVRPASSPAQRQSASPSGVLSRRQATPESTSSGRLFLQPADPKTACVPQSDGAACPHEA